MSENEVQTKREANYKTPSWVKVFGVVTLVLIILTAILMLTGEHGPGRHFPSVEATTTMEYGE